MNNSGEHNECRFADQVNSYACNELPLRESLALEEHLPGCAACAETVAELRRLQNAFGRLAFLTRLKGQTQVGSPVAAAPATAPSQMLAAILRGLEAAVLRAEASLDSVSVMRLRNWGQRLAANTGRAVENIAHASSSSLQQLQIPSLEALREIGWVWMQRVEPLALRVASPAHARSSKARFHAVPGGIIAASQGIEIKLEAVPGSKDVEMIAQGLPVSADRLMALLVLPEAPEKSQEAVLRRISDQEWTARFVNVIPGAYVVAIEPLANSIVE